MAAREHDHDDRLLLAAAAGDPQSFRAFQRRHAAAVAGFLLRRGALDESVDELADETFAAALIACPRYRPGAAAARDWLLRIAARKLRESRRCGRVVSAARRQLALEQIVLAGGPVGCDPVGGDTAGRVGHPVVLDPGAAILHVVGELEPVQREAVIARVLEERDYPDIAAELACTEASVRSHLRGGWEHLRERLAIAPV